MTIDVLIVLIGFVGLLIGSVTDLKKREVADWLSYGLIFSGLGLNAIKSIITADYFFFALSLVGLNHNK